MSLPRSLCFPADSTTMSEMFDSNLPADWYNLSSECSDYDAALAEAERQATASGSIGPLVKQELRLLIQTRRLSQGKEELRVGAAVSTTHELTAEEEKRKLRRKEQNRYAAQRFRKRKKFRECALSEDIVILEGKNTNLRSQIAQLRQLKDSLLKTLTSHASVCPHIPDVFSSRPHGNVCPSVLHVISPRHLASVCLSNHDVNIPSHLASVCISGHDVINPSHQASVCPSGQDIISPSHQARVCPSSQTSSVQVTKPVDVPVARTSSVQVTKPVSVPVTRTSSIQVTKPVSVPVARTSSVQVTKPVAVPVVIIPRQLYSVCANRHNMTTP